MGTLVYVGGYGSGISVYARDGARLALLGQVAAEDPSYLVADPRAQRLYAVNEQDSGAVTGYAVGADGLPRLLSSQPSGGALPCHLALRRGYLIAANYGSGSASVHAVGADGTLAPAADLVRHQGRGPDPDRQAGPHAHQVHLTGDLVTIVDLGLDRLVHYRLDTGTGRLVPAGESVAAPGSGPRHAVAHTSGRWYVSCELDSTVATFEPGGDGALLLAARTPATSSMVDGRNYPSGIALSADGRLLYLANRGADTIATFAVGADGRLAPVGEVSSGGAWPRQFTVDGDTMFVANQYSGSVVSLRLDRETGLPVPTGEAVEVAGPSCVLVTDWRATCGMSPGGQ